MRAPMLGARSLPLVARYTWARQWPAFLFDGLSFGVLNLTTFAVTRSLGAKESVVPFIIAVWQAFWIFSPAVEPLLARADPQKLWRRLAICAHLPVACIAFVAVRETTPGHGTGNLPLFLVCIITYYAFAIAYVPHRGALVRANYPAPVRGRVFGVLVAISWIGAAVMAKTTGYLLDQDPRWLRVVFPVAAVAGAIGFWFQGRVRWRHQKRGRFHEAIADRPLAAMRKAAASALRILRDDRHFRTYEVGFMLYGFGFLCSVPLLALYAESELSLSYGAYTWAQFVAFPLGMIVASGIWGRVIDRLRIARTSSATMIALAVFFTGMMFVDDAWGLAFAFALWGFAMAGVNVTWSLGPLHFAPDRQAHMYTAIHFSLVGVRSLVAPFLGYAVKEWFSYAVAFGLTVCFLLVGAVVTGRLARHGH